MRYLLDTHAWIWWNANERMLSKRAKQIITDPQFELYLSTMSVWEFSKLVQLGKLKINCDGLKWISLALEMPGLKLLELTPEVSWQSANLPGTFHRDPVDQVIVASARLIDAVVVTKDRLIAEYEFVGSVW